MARPRPAAAAQSITFGRCNAVGQMSIVDRDRGKNVFVSVCRSLKTEFETQVRCVPLGVGPILIYSSEKGRRSPLSTTLRACKNS